MLLHTTGWSPDILDAQPQKRIEDYLLFIEVKNALDTFGDRP